MEANNEHTDHVFFFFNCYYTHTRTHTHHGQIATRCWLCCCLWGRSHFQCGGCLSVRLGRRDAGSCTQNTSLVAEETEKSFLFKNNNKFKFKKSSIVKIESKPTLLFSWLSWLWYWRKGGEASNKESRREGGHEWVSSFYLSLPKIQHSSSEGACQLSVMVLNVQTWKVQGGLIVIWGDYRLLLFNQI